MISMTPERSPGGRVPRLLAICLASTVLFSVQGLQARKPTTKSASKPYTLVELIRQGMRANHAVRAASLKALRDAKRNDG